MGLLVPSASQEENRFTLFQIAAAIGVHNIPFFRFNIFIAFNYFISCILHTSNPFCASGIGLLACSTLFHLIFRCWYYKAHVLLLGSFDLCVKWQAQWASLAQLEWTQSPPRPEKVPWRKLHWERQRSHELRVSHVPAWLGRNILKDIPLRLTHGALA